MVSGTITQALGGLGTILIVVSLWVWKGVRNVRTNFGDEYGKMRNHLKSKFRRELNVVVNQILDEVNFDDLDDDGEQPVRVLTMEAIETKIERDELGDVEDTLREFDRPEELLNEVKDTYDQAWRYFGIGGCGCFAIIIIRMFMNGDAGTFVQFIAGLITAIYIIAAIMDFNNARQAERDLEDMIDSYREEY